MPAPSERGLSSGRWRRRWWSWCRPVTVARWSLFTSHGALRATANGDPGPAGGRPDILVLAQGPDGSPGARHCGAGRRTPGRWCWGRRRCGRAWICRAPRCRCWSLRGLPFAVPSDPVYAARAELYDEPFMQYAVPQAIVRFRQGFGRLIRRQRRSRAWWRCWTAASPARATGAPSCGRCRRWRSQRLALHEFGAATAEWLAAVTAARRSPAGRRCCARVGSRCGRCGRRRPAPDWLPEAERAVLGAARRAAACATALTAGDAVYWMGVVPGRSVARPRVGALAAREAEAEALLWTWLAVGAERRALRLRRRGRAAAGAGGGHRAGDAPSGRVLVAARNGVALYFWLRLGYRPRGGGMLALAQARARAPGWSASSSDRRRCALRFRRRRGRIRRRYHPAAAPAVARAGGR